MVELELIRGRSVGQETGTQNLFTLESSDGVKESPCGPPVQNEVVHW